MIHPRHFGVLKAEPPPSIVVHNSITKNSEKLVFEPAVMPLNPGEHSQNRTKYDHGAQKMGNIQFLVFIFWVLITTVPLKSAIVACIPLKVDTRNIFGIGIVLVGPTCSYSNHIPGTQKRGLWSYRERLGKAWQILRLSPCSKRVAQILTPQVGRKHPPQPQWSGLLGLADATLVSFLAVFSLQVAKGVYLFLYVPSR